MGIDPQARRAPADHGGGVVPGLFAQHVSSARKASIPHLRHALALFIFIEKTGAHPPNAPPGFPLFA
ncbi:hypothetical protein GCM10009754_11330 [Amycolatopsis minnesotensis]|uniref:Uncharacterized protein n=1 Tax=Amycolatopsis minnesotensis TaxID=337894 RepID=A0ABP5BID4_9PSEU